MEQTMQNPEQAIQTQIKTKQPTDLSLLVLGSAQYTPTQLQTQTLLEYLQDEDGLTPARILKKNGHCADNWWLWPKRYPNFIAWWNGIIEQVFTEQRLNDLYKALYMRGMQQDTAAVKLLMQRFDPKYTERSTHDQRLTFAGYEPGLAADSRARQHRALSEPTQASPVPVLPAGQATATNTGIDHTQATQSAEHAQDIDQSLDFEPITKVDPPRGRV